MKCGDRVVYRRNNGTIRGKRYGHAVNPHIGLVYDIRMDNGERFLDVPHCELEEYKEPEEPTTYVAGSYGSAMPIHLVKHDGKRTPEA